MVLTVWGFETSTRLAWLLEEQSFMESTAGWYSCKGDQNHPHLVDCRTEEGLVDSVR